jgi:hypothetical protein
MVEVLPVPGLNRSTKRESSVEVDYASNSFQSIVSSELTVRRTSGEAAEKRYQVQYKAQSERKTIPEPHG